MRDVDSTQQARAAALPNLWVQRRPRSSRERLHSWKVAAFSIDSLMMVFAIVAFDFFNAAEGTPFGWRVLFSLFSLGLFLAHNLYTTRLRVQFGEDLPRV